MTRGPIQTAGKTIEVDSALATGSPPINDGAPTPRCQGGRLPCLSDLPLLQQTRVHACAMLSRSLLNKQTELTRFFASNGKPRPPAGPPRPSPSRPAPSSRPCSDPFLAHPGLQPGRATRRLSLALFELAAAPAQNPRSKSCPRRRPRVLTWRALKTRPGLLREGAPGPALTCSSAPRRCGRGPCRGRGR